MYISMISILRLTQTEVLNSSMPWPNFGILQFYSWNLTLSLFATILEKKKRPYRFTKNKATIQTYLFIFTIIADIKLSAKDLFADKVNLELHGSTIAHTSSWIGTFERVRRNKQVTSHTWITAKFTSLQCQKRSICCPHAFSTYFLEQFLGIIHVKFIA